MTILDFALVILVYFESSTGIMIALALMILSWSVSMGPLPFIHPQETCLEFTVGISYFMIFISTVVNGFLGSVIMESYGAIYVFGTFFIISVFFTIYIACFVKDTTYK